MISDWETDEERLLRFLKIPPKEKMEWLYRMNEFINKYSSTQSAAIRQKIREPR